jgi:hypothetical protein
MKRVRTLSLLALTALGLRCSSSKPPQSSWDHAADFASLKTFGWYADPADEKQMSGAIVDARFLDEHVKKAVGEQLAKKGFRPAAGDDADFYMDYHTRASAVVDRDKYGVYSWWGPVVWAGSEYARENTLVLDVRDSSKKLIWRGWITRFAGRNPEEVARAIDRAVSGMLSSFPPTAGQAPTGTR